MLFNRQAVRTEVHQYPEREPEKGKHSYHCLSSRT